MFQNPSKKEQKLFDFKADLNFGKKGEEFVKQMISNSNGKFEVKIDRMAITTGNIVLEIECYGKPSGIATTEADWLTYLISHKDEIVSGFTFNVAVLRRNLKKMKSKFHIAQGGENHASKMFIIPLGQVHLLMIP